MSEWELIVICEHQSRLTRRRDDGEYGVRVASDGSKDERLTKCGGLLAGRRHGREKGF
jgi:hypothetical protein